MHQPDDSSSDRDPLDRLAEEFVARYRQGERPSLEDFAARLPERADEVRQLFPALVEIELLKPRTGEFTGDYVPTPTTPGDPTQVGEYRILRRVGQGGMGVVYEAVQESLGRHVALKLLPAEALLDPKRLERFRREAKSAACLHHTNIVPVFGTGEADGRHYYAMQFIAGHPLDAVIEEVRRLNAHPTDEPSAAVSLVAEALLTGSFAAQPDPHAETMTLGGNAAAEEASVGSTSTSTTITGTHTASASLSTAGGSYWMTVARIGVQVASALAYAHEQGVLHRDIKPSNLMLDLRGTVWVTDFGLAKNADAEDITHTGDVIGTLRYMAPERFDGTDDHRADIYALGLTLYELLTMTPAFNADKRAKLLEQVLAANPARPRSVNPAIPRDLETIILKAIARDPAARYPTAGELAEDMQRYIEGRTILARRASIAEQAWRWCKRNPAVASLMTSTVVALIVGTIVSTSFAMLASDRAKQAQGEAKRADDQRQAADEARQIADQRADEITRQQAETRWLLYASRMNLASGFAKEYRTTRLEEFLTEAKPTGDEPDLRGWEWHYFHRLSHSTSRTINIDAVKQPKQLNGGTQAEVGPSVGMMNARFSWDGKWLIAPPMGLMFGVSKRMPTNPGAVIDRATGKLVRTIPPRNYLQSRRGGEPHLVRLEGIPDPAAPDKMKVRMYVDDVVTGKERVPPINLPLTVPKTDDEQLNRFQSPISHVVVSPDSEVVKALSDKGQTVYTWRRGSGAVEERRLRTSDKVDKFRWMYSSQLTNDGRCVFVTRPAGDAAEQPAGRSTRTVIELHDLTGSVADPVTLEYDPALPMSGLVTSVNGTMLAVLEGKAGRVVRILDTQKKEWVGRWTIPTSIPLAWDSQTNSVVQLNVSDDGQRVILGGSTGLYILGERLGVGETVPNRRPTEGDEWRTTVLLAPTGTGRGLEATWLAPDGRSFAIYQAIYGPPTVHEWDLRTAPNTGTTWPEWLLIAGVNCQRQPASRVGSFDIYVGHHTPREKQANATIVVAVRDYTTGQIVRQVQWKEDLVTKRGVMSMTVLSLTACGTRALITVMEPQLDFEVNSKQVTRKGVQQSHTLLVALDQPEKPILKHFAQNDDPDGEAYSTLLLKGRWLLAAEIRKRPRDHRLAPPNTRTATQPYQRYSAVKGEAVGTLPSDPHAWQNLHVVRSALSRDGELLLALTVPTTAKPDAKDTRYTLRAYEMATGQEVWQRECPATEKLDQLGSSIDLGSCFSADGRAMVMAQTDAKGATNAWLIEVATGRTLRELVVPTVGGEQNPWQRGLDQIIWFPTMVVGPKNQLLLYTMSQVLLWNGEDQLGQRLKGHDVELVGATFSTDGARLFTADANDQGRRTIHVWDTRTARELITIGEPSSSAKVHCHCEDMPTNMRVVDGKLILDSFRGQLIFDGSPQREKP